jgi:hypothetical protein
MTFFRSRRLRYLVVASFALAILLTQGARVYLHVHDVALHEAPASTDDAMHAHVEKGLSVPDPYDGTADTVDVSFDAILKLLNLHPLLALVAVTLLFLFARRPDRFVPPSGARLYFLDPPYLTPPGHGPPL